jgi:hypothetical protein
MMNVISNESHLELRKAAVFGLLASVNSSSKARNLMNILGNRNESQELRVEVLKTLFWYKDSRKERLIIQLANDTSEDRLVRLAAIKGIETLNRSSTNRNYLTRIARMDSDPEIKAEALRALKFKLSEKDIRWWRLSRDPQGNPRNPLDY